MTGNHEVLEQLGGLEGQDIQFSLLREPVDSTKDIAISGLNLGVRLRWRKTGYGQPSVEQTVVIQSLERVRSYDVGLIRPGSIIASPQRNSLRN